MAIARTVARQSRYVLADEPVASLDPESAKSVLSVRREIAQERLIAILLSLHQVELALQLADRIIGLRGGRMITDRRPADLTGTDNRMILAT